MNNDLRLELRCRNAALWHAIFDTHKNVAAFCRALYAPNVLKGPQGIQGIIGAWLNLTKSPYGRRGELRQMARKICVFTGFSADELFPPALYASVQQSRVAVEIPHQRLMALSAALRLPSPLDSPDRHLLATERAQIVQDVLKTLTPRQEQVIRMRFGFDDYEEHTHAAIGQALDGISKERIRQIELKALHKLRHPKRARYLRSVADARALT